MNPVKRILGDVSKNKLYVKGPYGYRVRFHKTTNPSPAVLNAMELFIDQIHWRSEEWGLRSSKYKDGITSLAIHCAEEHNLRGDDLSTFVNELKARKYGVDWNKFNKVMLK